MFHNQESSFKGSIQEILRFPFYRLLETKSLDYVTIVEESNKLKEQAHIREFYGDYGKSLTYSLEFIITYINFLAKNKDSDTPVISLLELLHIILLRINYLELECNVIDRIITVIVRLFANCNLRRAQYIAGTIAAQLVTLKNVDACDLAELCKLCICSFTLFEEEFCRLEMCRLVGAILKNIGKIKYNTSGFNTWLENDCVEYFREENEPKTLFVIMECFQYYYIRGKECGPLAINLKAAITKICTLMKNPMLRNTAEIILVFLLHQLLLWDGLKSRNYIELYKEIQALPNDWFQWPELDCSVFFVIAYFMFLHSKLLWDHQTILKSLNRYKLELPMASQDFIALKSVAMLYPLTIGCNSNLVVHQNTNTLINILSESKNLSKLLTYHPIQIAWLFTHGDTNLKLKVVICWILNQEDDHDIVDILNITQQGQILVEFLVLYPKTRFSSRVSKLIGKLTITLEVGKSIDQAMLLLCNHLEIFSQLLQVRHPWDPCNALQLIRMVAGCLPLLEDDLAVRSACNYGVLLLTHAKDEPNAFLMFSNFSATIRFLIMKIVGDDDDNALSAAKLLRRLINNQIRTNTISNDQITVDVTATLRGSTKRIVSGLKLFRVLLIRNGCLLTIPNTFEMYHFMHTFVTDAETAPDSYKILKILLVRSNGLAFSLATPYSLQEICKVAMPMASIKSFLPFLGLWLKLAMKIPHLDLPIKSLLGFLDIIPYQDEHYEEAMQCLQSHNNRLQNRSVDGSVSLLHDRHSKNMTASLQKNRTEFGSRRLTSSSEGGNSRSPSRLG